MEAQRDSTFGKADTQMMHSKPRRKVITIFGTRPEAIKLAPVVAELKRRGDQFDAQAWVTAQHRQMLDQVIDTFEIVPDRDFDLMVPGQSLTQITTAVLTALDKVFAKERPDCILVQGDTTTAFAAALAAFYARVKVGHIEAGLRTYNKFAPYPEEINRQLATRLSDYHFAPTEVSKANLVKEGVDSASVIVTGNTVIDALLTVAEQVRRERPSTPEDLNLERLGSKRLILITGHRRESFGEGFEQICQAVAELARRYPDVEIVYPVHLNPNVREPVFRILAGLNNVQLIEPVSYKPFVWLMDRATILLTDSGGIQEEAPSLGKPVLVMRDVTERPEGVDAGTSILVGANVGRIVEHVTMLLDNKDKYEAMSRLRNPYGDGNASQRIADTLHERL